MASHLFIVAWNSSMGRMKPIAILIAAAFLGSVSTLTPTAHAQPTPLYLLDFGSPPHTVGLPPATGAGPAPRNTVTSVWFGAPTVASSVGSLTDQPLKFDSLDGKYDQILLGLRDLPLDHVYCIESDVLIDTNTRGRKFVILHDTPTIRNIEFINGVISAYVPYGVTDPYPGTPIGTYALGQVIRVHSEVDLAADAWKIFLDGILVHSGSFGRATRLSQIRVSTMWGTVAAIDNVHVAPNHCEPELDEAQGVGADTVPPTTTATPNPGPNGNGWNSTNVTVRLSAVDNPGGSGVKQISYALSGAQGGGGVATGSSTSVAIATEGTTTLTYFARDNAGNQEAPRSLTIRIDRTPPVISGLPAPGCTLWPPNHKLVQVGTVTASDGLSGLVPGSLTIRGTSNEPPLEIGSGQTSPDIVITGPTVQLRAERSGTGTGRIYALTAEASDLAGNRATGTATCTVPHDQRK